MWLDYLFTAAPGGGFRVFSGFGVLLCWLHGVGGFVFALAFPCCVSGLLALPLCGAALTFFAAAKKDKQRKRLHTASS
jgi:hypothetical protein